MIFRRICTVALVLCALAPRAEAASGSSITAGPKQTALIGTMTGVAADGDRATFALVASYGLTLATTGASDPIAYASLLACEETCELRNLAVSELYYIYDQSRENAYLTAVDDELGPVSMVVSYYSLRASRIDYVDGARGACPGGDTAWDFTLSGAVQADPATGKGGIRDAWASGTIGRYTIEAPRIGQTPFVFARYVLAQTRLEWSGDGCP